MDASTVTYLFGGVVVLLAGVCIANCIYMRRHPEATGLGEALLNRNFLEFMPGLNRRDVEELTLDMERWECSVCAFMNLVTKPICSLCSTHRDYRLIEFYSDTVPAHEPEKPSRSMSQRASKSLQRQTSKSFQRLSMRKQWTRQLDTKGNVVWARHFLDTEECPASFVIQTGPIRHEVGDSNGPDVSVTVIIHDSTTLGSAETPGLDAIQTIAWVPIEGINAATTVTGLRLLPSTWSSLLPISRLPFSLKYAWFLHQVSDLIVPYADLHIQTKVQRARVFEEALENLLGIKGQGLCAIIRYNFIGESGLDAGAIQREWYTLVAHALLHEESGLFTLSNRDDNSYFINPNSAHDTSHLDVQLEHLELFRAAGRFIGRALLDGQVLPIQLSPVLFKALLGVPMTLDDVESLDKTTYTSLQYIVQNDRVDDLALTFSVTQCFGDRMLEVDLIENGHEMAVTDANKHEYIALMVRHLLFGRVETQLLALIEGVYDVLPPELLTAFDHKELELILCGLHEIDLADWQANTVTSSNLDNTPVLEWFWNIVSSLPQDDQAKLLQYATGASRVPVQGFKGLTSYDGKICYFTLKGVAYKQGVYPVAHACYNRIDLPLYPSEELLKDALKTLLLSDPTGFNIE
ncbi:hypothetical protein SPRG_02638 [Saprolegnia parasitica CBS 223.65]|uniref:HECT-type E3 ubiquitin transferase n=1 Tax=Saprolegnia parasitica (strain CBS 223.65) TaxID=695850 RepID=A0A067CUK1_SAPPC|nr:hypothetical protein SPRG_02638 [Saprolegnia parasitica CBS 223.65]KDO32945.1 hypothetical protein SPRG_02638 [Saprolegnia parasitica CBS 223.65]|eukprot:XP_012196592.1 hypothetical protein SPRG_02638 [Saprolegnia parasitica CBS 223.65]